MGQDRRSIVAYDCHGVVLPSGTVLQPRICRITATLNAKHRFPSGQKLKGQPTGRCAKLGAASFRFCYLVGSQVDASEVSARMHAETLNPKPETLNPKPFARSPSGERGLQGSPVRFEMSSREE